jgi:hypothetical protein
MQSYAYVKKNRRLRLALSTAEGPRDDEARAGQYSTRAFAASWKSLGRSRSP